MRLMSDPKKVAVELFCGKILKSISKECIKPMQIQKTII